MSAGAWILHVGFACVFGYLLGSINFATLFARAKGIDLATLGTQNPGTMNATYAMGVPVGVCVLVLDALKAIVAYVVVRLLNPTVTWLAPLAGLMAVVGHVFSLWLKFNGGRGLACLAGLVLATLPPLGSAVIIGVSLGFSLVSKGNRWAIILGCALYGACVVLLALDFGSTVFLLAATVLVIAKNIPVVKGVTAGSELSTSDVLHK